MEAVASCHARAEEFLGNLQDMKKRGFNRNRSDQKKFWAELFRRGEPILPVLHAVIEKNVGGSA